jgi:hypothetical protein
MTEYIPIKTLAGIPLGRDGAVWITVLSPMITFEWVLFDSK